jgi:holin-like protein
MVLLLSALLSGKLKLESIEEFGDFLLSHLAIFFIPASVGLMAVFGLLKGTWYILLFISVISTLIIMITTAYTVKFLRRWVK